MDLKEIVKKKEKIVALILNGVIGEAIKLISELAYTSREGLLISEIEELEQTYKNILKYSFGYAKDPERDKIYLNLQRRLTDLTEDIVQIIIEKESDFFSSLKKDDAVYFNMGEQEKIALIDEMSTEKEFTNLLNEVESNEGSTLESEGKYSETLLKIFDILWLTNNYHDAEKTLISRLFDAKHIPWYDKSITVTALTLSNLRHFDAKKMELLFDIYNKSEEQVWHRALVGIIISLLIHKDKLHLYPEIENRVKSIEDPKSFARQTEQIILQFIRAQETEKVTEKIQKEIIPEVMKLRPEIEEKLKLDDLLNKENLEDKNPDWEQFFSDTPDVYKKLEEFSMMQLDGSDVFMGAFSMLKRFGFFEGLYNWFLPFYKEHPEVSKAARGVDDNFNWKDFFEGIEQAPVMCNSDKYSFCFNIGFMPDMQKTMMLELFSSELKQMKELSDEDNKHNVASRDKIIFAQYIQDLYRFYKLHPQRKLFNDVFQHNLSVQGNSFLNKIFEEKNLRQIGEFYFEKNYYNKAMDIFKMLLEGNKQYELIEKIGFCYQKLGRFEKAIEYYKQAEIFDTKRIWLKKKLGYCYRSIGDFDTAIEYYQKVESVEAENLEIKAYLGQLHIDKEDYQKALEYYFMVEYLKPDLKKVQRPIAWCSFLLGKFDQSIKYFEKVSQSEGQRSDYLNLGHCYWASGNLTEAIENYRLALKRSGSDEKWLVNTLNKDKLYLNRYGIEDIEIALMSDYIILDLN